MAAMTLLQAATAVIKTATAAVETTTNLGMAPAAVATTEVATTTRAMKEADFGARDSRLVLSIPGETIRFSKAKQYLRISRT